MEAKYASERIEMNYQAIKKDIGRHETLCFELATKFEHTHEVFV
jgi:hypothetical protein